MTNFIAFELVGADAEKFLQGQITANVKKLDDQYQATAISNLKGRVDFGLWIKKLADEQFEIVVSQDTSDEFAKHIKKYGAFSKMTLSQGKPIFLSLDANNATFSHEDNNISATDWAKQAIENGQFWITADTRGLFQPQELRLHQQGGVDYDKGCYLGQEIIARLWFKASPKAWLHRVGYQDEDVLTDKIQVVNQVQTDSGFEALVVARPEDISAAGLTVLDLPEALSKDVARAR